MPKLSLVTNVGATTYFTFFFFIALCVLYHCCVHAYYISSATGYTTIADVKVHCIKTIKEKNLNGRIQSIILFANRKHLHRFSVLSLSRSSLPKTKYLETKYGILDISSAIFGLYFSYLLFIGIFSQILIWWTVAQMTPAVL